MSPIRLIARPMLAAGYILNGVERLRKPEAAAASVGPLQSGSQAGRRPRRSSDSRPSHRCCTGRCRFDARHRTLPRLSASILVGTYLLDTVGERLSADKTKSKEEKKARNERTLLRTSMLGGALLAAVDTAGRPGLWWRTQHAAEDLWSSVEDTSKQALSALGVD